MNTDDYWLWEIWLLTISYRCIFNISESPENWRSRVHLAKTYLGFRTQGAEERWHTHSPLDRILVHRGLFPLPSPLSLVPNVCFPWCFLGNMTQAIWSRHCERKRIAQAWLQKMVILPDSLTVLRHRVFNPLSGIPRIFRRGHYTNKKRTFDWRSPHLPHDGYSKDN